MLQRDKFTMNALKKNLNYKKDLSKITYYYSSEFSLQDQDHIDN